MSSQSFPQLLVKQMVKRVTSYEYLDFISFCFYHQHLHEIPLFYDRLQRTTTIIEFVTHIEYIHRMIMGSHWLPGVNLKVFYESLGFQVDNNDRLSLNQPLLRFVVPTNIPPQVLQLLANAPSDVVNAVPAPIPVQKSQRNQPQAQSRTKVRAQPNQPSLQVPVSTQNLFSVNTICDELKKLIDDEEQNIPIDEHDGIKVLEDYIGNETTSPNYFTYMLLDGLRLPANQTSCSFAQFVYSIFYVGKGTRARLLDYLFDDKKNEA